MSKQKPALDERKQQLVTCIQLATEHVRDQKTDTNPNKRNVYSIKSAYQIEYDRKEAPSRDFQSNSQKNYKQHNMRWADLVLIEEREVVCNSFQSFLFKISLSMYNDLALFVPFDALETHTDLSAPA